MVLFPGMCLACGCGQTDNKFPPLMALSLDRKHPEGQGKTLRRIHKKENRIVVHRESNLHKTS